jgi:hypothetical protein
MELQCALVSYQRKFSIVCINSVFDLTAEKQSIPEKVKKQT